MNKKILYIDPISSFGHKMFNEIWINDLLKLGCSVDLVSCAGYFDFIDKTNKNVRQVLDLEEKLFLKLKDNNPFLNRIRLFRILMKIKKSIDFSSYDFIIFSSYEEISFYFARFSKKCYLVNHNNLSRINHFIKYFFVKRISKKHKLIVLHDKFKRKLSEIGVESVFIPHGLPTKFQLKNDKFNFYENAKLILFSPSSLSSDEHFFRKLISDIKFLNYLEENKIILILKGNYDVISPFIVILAKYLSQNEYRNVFLKSDVILINYNESFKNRVSGVFYEAISNEKIIMTSKYFYDEMDIDEEGIFIFSDFKSFENNLDAILQKKNIMNNLCRDKEKYCPNIISRIENEC